MKRIVLILMTALVTPLAALADVAINSTNFPDANFRAFLESEYPSHTITTSQLNSRTELLMESKNIADLTGIQYFTQLTKLDCWNNKITSVNLSANTKLKYLNLGYNKLTSINVSAHTDLEELYLQNNQLSSSLNVTHHSRLSTLWVHNNASLVAVNCSDNNLTNFEVSGCTSLTTLECYDNINLSTITGLASCTNLMYLDCEECRITDLSALSGMANLAEIYCARNLLTSLELSQKTNLATLDVSSNPRLTYLLCSRNNLQSLNVTDCTALEDLRCFYNNQLSSITGLADCTALKYLDCDGCKLTDLSALGSMDNLEQIYCANNKLTSLNIPQKTNLTNLDASGNDQLISLVCSRCYLIDLNVTGCTALEDLKCFYNNRLERITGLADCTALKYLDCEDCRISDLSALSELANLEEIYCGRNHLTSLELSQKYSLTTLVVTGNVQLTNLLCSRCNLQSLNVTGCTALEDLRCFYNQQLASITGLGDCTALKYLDCDGCKLTDLSVLDSMDYLEQIYCGNNQLTSLELSQKSYLTNLDASGNDQMNSLDCPRCNLIELDVTGCTALENLKCFYNNRLERITGLADCTAMKYLDCEDCRIADLNAVSGMTNLETLLCRGNQLTTLDVSGKHQLSVFMVNSNPLLTSLNCDSCNLTSLNLTACYALEEVICNDNHISSLDVTECPALYILWCYNNELTELDLSQNSEMLMLWCRNNKLTELDLSNCPDEFLSLDCAKNYLTSLELGRFTQLKQIACYDNQISSLDLANLTGLKDLYCYTNPLTGLDVSGCSALERVRTMYCQLTSLNITDCPSLREIAIYYNRLKGQPMGQFVDALPQRPADNKGQIYAVVFDYENDAEGNHMTSVQVDQAVAKNWDLYAYSDGMGWIPYGGEMMLGDVNGDGVVSIADVTTLIDALLAGESPAAGDVNGDFNVSIADVTTLIDGLLSGSYNLTAHAGNEGSISIDKNIQLTIDREELQARHNRLRAR